MAKAGADSSAGERENGSFLLELSKHLLRTKLYTPAIRSSQIARPRLLDLMNGGLDRSLILVSAPAGYGKTTLVSNWLAQTDLASAWLSLDEGDNDPIRFLQYLLTALVPITPAIADNLLEMPQGIQPDQFENIINHLVNDLASFSKPFILVLDDFHAIQSEAVLRVVSYLLEHQPHQMHLVILTRTDPPLSLSRLRVRNQLLDIRADHLRFTHAEIAEFLNTAGGIHLSDQDLAAMEARTEGWIAGLQLAALSMKSSSDIHGFVSAFTGSHHYVMDYLAEEVLKAQPGKVTTFLLQTSILDRLCGPICEAILGTDTTELTDGQAMLETLEAMNLFVIPLDDERRWYRYHHLFADVLRKRLEQQYSHLLPELHRRTSQWYEQNGFVSESIQQAIAAGDQDRAAQLIEQNGCFLLISGEVSTFLSWTDSIVYESKTRPWLAIQRAWSLALTGNLDQVESTLQVPEQLLTPLEPTIEVKTMLGTIAAARAFCADSRGNTSLAKEYAQKALEQLPDCSSISRSIRSVAMLILGDSSWMIGELEQAAQAYTKAIGIGRDAGNAHMVINANSSLADIYLEQGQYHRAADAYTRSLQMAVRPDGQLSPLASRNLLGLGRISFERNQLEDAYANTRHCIELSQKWGDVNLKAGAYAMLARLEQVRSNLKESQEAARNALQLAEEHSLSTNRFIQVNSDLARLWLAQGNREKVSHLIQKAGLAVDDDIPYQREPEFVILLRLLIAQRNIEAALALSERLMQTAQAAGRMGLVAEVLILQALEFQEKKDTESALEALERAFSLAQPEGLVRLFLDEGEPMTRLLCQSQSRQVGVTYATELMSTIGQTSSMTQPSMQLLIEPLTTRELEVLKFIETGNTNQEIAENLVISTATVKRHITNIYGKLGVKNRTQSIAIGKELKLFD